MNESTKKYSYAAPHQTKFSQAPAMIKHMLQYLYVNWRMFAFVVGFSFFSDMQTLAGKNVSKMTYFMSSWA